MLMYFKVMMYLVNNLLSNGSVKKGICIVLATGFKFDIFFKKVIF